MKYRILAAFVVSVLVFGLGGSTFADSKAKKSNASELVSLLPASDGVMTVDVKRFFGEALPKLLSSNQPILARITGEIDKFKSKTGIDIRQFESIAAGVTSERVSDKKHDVEPVIIARGRISSASLIGAAKLASNGKYTEERVGERTIYIFSIARLASDKDPANVSGPIAVTAIDSTTIAFGTLERVRQTVEANTKVGSDLTVLLEQNPTAVTSFAAKLPTGMKEFVPLDNDELGKNIDSIQYIYGNANVAGDIASIRTTARTLQNAQAQSLHETLEGLQMLGKAFLGNAKGADKQVFARLISNVKFSVRANEVTLDLQVPQSDIDILVGALKMK